MASQPISPAIGTAEQNLTDDQWWELFHRLRLAQQGEYSKVGGPIAFIRHERDADAPSA